MGLPANILIIDDDTDDQNFLIEALKDIDASIKVFTANNGRAALFQLDRNAIPLPSIIFLDLNMPRINGRQFLFEVKNHPDLKSIPVIVYSASSNERDVSELKKLGAAMYLVKQSEYVVLKEELYSICHHYNDLHNNMPVCL